MPLLHKWIYNQPFHWSENSEWLTCLTYQKETMRHSNSRTYTSRCTTFSYLKWRWLYILLSFWWFYPWLTVSNYCELWILTEHRCLIILTLWYCWELFVVFYMQKQIYSEGTIYIHIISELNSVKFWFCFLNSWGFFCKINKWNFNTALGINQLYNSGLF